MNPEIEQLKKNERAWKFLSDEERACFIEVGVENCWYIGLITGDAHQATTFNESAGTVFQIKNTYQPEPEIEKCEVKLSRDGLRLYYRRNGNEPPLSRAIDDPDYSHPEDENGSRLPFLRMYQKGKPAEWPYCLVFVKGSTEARTESPSSDSASEQGGSAQIKKDYETLGDE